MENQCICVVQKYVISDRDHQEGNHKGYWPDFAHSLHQGCEPLHAPPWPSLEWLRIISIFPGLYTDALLCDDSWLDEESEESDDETENDDTDDEVELSHELEEEEIEDSELSDEEDSEDIDEDVSEPSEDEKEIEDVSLLDCEVSVEEDDDCSEADEEEVEEELLHGPR